MQNPNLVSCWDEPITPPTNTDAVAQAGNAASSLQMQLVGIVGVLAVVAAVTVSVAVAVTSPQTSTTKYLMTSTTTTTTGTTTTVTTNPPNPYACSNMTFLNNTDFPGNDIGPSPTMNYTTCCTFCLNTTACVAFSWISGQSVCYRKSSLGSGPVNVTGIISSKY